MKKIMDVYSRQTADFHPQESRAATMGNRRGKQYEVGNIEDAQGSNQIELFTRTVDGKEYADIWQLFRQAGLPVVPQLWIDEEDKIYMPNLTADGSAFYGKGYADAYAVMPQELDQAFLQLIDRDFARITQQADRLSQQATANGLLLPLDDGFDLHVSADGRRFDLVILDLEYGGTLEDLLERKQRFAQGRAQAALLNFQGKGIDQLDHGERRQLIALINETTKKAALEGMKQAARRVKELYGK